MSGCERDVVHERIEPNVGDEARAETFRERDAPFQPRCGARDAEVAERVPTACLSNISLVHWEDLCARDPLAACVRISVMMHRSLANLQAVLVQPDAYRGAKSAAAVIGFPAAIREARRGESCRI